MREVYVAGAAMTRFGKFPDTTIRALAEEAVRGALGDAGVAPGDVGMVFFSNAVAGILTNQEMIRGQVALRHTGLLGVPMVNVENACASASSAFHLACMAVGSGAVDVALAVGSEKLTHEDRSRSFAAIGTAVDQMQVAELQQWASSGSAGSPLPEQADSVPAGAGDAASEQAAGKRSFFMDIYAVNSRAYMKSSGATREDFARVAVKSHRHAALNPYAQYRTEVTVDDVLASREIAPPLTLLMCSPIGDGAAALVVCSPEMARRLGARVQVRACALVSGRDRGPGEPGAAERAAQAAYEQAGVGPGDLDVVELHDAAAPAELMTYEEVGLCGPGEGPALLASGATALGGRLPVNPSGGLLSKGHPIGATGCGQLVELSDQLRGRCGQRQVAGARVALAQNGGGFLGTDAAAMVVTVLST
jgi:acetyl-CoA acetyltransferase